MKAAIYGIVSILSLVLNLVSTGVVAQDLEVVSHKVSVQYSNERQQNIFLIDGLSSPSLDLLRGVTYVFDLSDPSLSSHPFKFSVKKDGIHSGGDQFTDSVKAQGIPGTPGATIALTVFSNSKPNIYFYCEFHPGMGGDATPTILGEAANLFEGFFNPASNTLSVPRIYVDTTPPALYSLQLNLLSDGKRFGLSEAIEGRVDERTVIDPLQSKFALSENLLEIPLVKVADKEYIVTLKLDNSNFSVASAEENTFEDTQDEVVINNAEPDYDPDDY